MNSCESYQELISRLVDGEISHDEHEALMAHMKTCSRCNAMYAVFHDLSDILSEESGELPEGLHENIMAGVRRSEIIRKNRRMRKLGLRTALAAAACLVLVLFAASGFGPRLGMENVAVRSEEEAARIAAVPENAAASAQNEAVPLPTAVAAPVRDAAQTVPDAALAAGDSTETQYNTTQQNQQFPIQPVTPEADDYTPAQVYTPAPVYTQTPVYIPETVYTPVPVYTPTPDYTQPQEFAFEPDYPSAPDFAFAAQDTSPMREPEQPGTPETAEISAPEQRAAAVPEMKAAPSEKAGDKGEEPFSFFTSDRETFDAPYWDVTEDALDEEPPIEETAPEDETYGGEADEPETPEEPEKSEEPAPKSPDEQRLTIRGKEARARLLALLDGSEEALPEEAELTRVVNLALVPEDEYGGEEKLDIRVYGDFVFYRVYAAEGGSASYRAACSLSELDGFLKTLASAPTMTPAPTPDSYADA